MFAEVEEFSDWSVGQIKYKTKKNLMTKTIIYTHFFSWMSGDYFLKKLKADSSPQFEVKKKHIE